MTLHVVPPPRTPLPLVDIEPSAPAADVLHLPMSPAEARHYVAVRLVALSATLDEYGIEDYPGDLRHLAAGLATDVPASLVRRR